jgi:hypothetical protein
MSNEAAAVELGVELLRAVDVGFDAEGELQATVSSNSDAIAAARFIGFTAGTVGRRFGYGLAVRRAAALGLTDQRQGGCRQHGSDHEESDREQRCQPLGTIVMKDQAGRSVEQEQRAEDQAERCAVDVDEPQGEDPDDRQPVPGPAP